MFASWEFTCQEISHPPPPIYVRGVDIRCGKEMGDEVLREFLFGFRESLFTDFIRRSDKTECYCAVMPGPPGVASERF